MGLDLPLETDVLIAQAMVERASRFLEGRGFNSIVFPPVVFSPCPFAQSFPGTISLRPEVAVEVLIDIGSSVAQSGFQVFAIGNAHFDPANLEVISAAKGQLKRRFPSLVIVNPNLTRRPWRTRLGDEFNSGACHAGRYETSIVLALRPDLVRPLAKTLPCNPQSLPEAMRNGARNFVESGGPRAYFGFPAEASALEGEHLIEILGEILYEAICYEI